MCVGLVPSWGGRAVSETRKMQPGGVVLTAGALSPLALLSELSLSPKLVGCWDSAENGTTRPLFSWKS